MDLPLHLVAPLKVKNKKANMKTEIANDIANLVKAWNYYSCKFFLTTSMKTYAFMMKKTQ
jgi:hypothetical protein